MKELREIELTNIQGGFNKSFWNGVCDGAIYMGLALLAVPASGQVAGGLAIGGLSLLGCISGPAK